MQLNFYAVYLNLLIVIYLGVFYFLRFQFGFWGALSFSVRLYCVNRGVAQGMVQCAELSIPCVMHWKFLPETVPILLNCFKNFCPNSLDPIAPIFIRYTENLAPNSNYIMIFMQKGMSYIPGLVWCKLHKKQHVSAFFGKSVLKCHLT